MSTNSEIRTKPNSFIPLFRELQSRVATPAGQVSYWVYMLLGIVGFGGVAIWVELVRFGLASPCTRHVDSIATAINTYFPAVGCAAAVQLAYAAENAKKKYLFSFSLLVGFLFAVFALLVLVFQQAAISVWSVLVGSLGCLLAFVMAWIANSEEAIYHDEINLDATLGGSPEKPLSGDTSGYTV